MSEKVWKKIAWLLPRKLVYWCSIRVWAHGTQGQYSNESGSELTCADALRRWMP